MQKYAKRYSVLTNSSGNMNGFKVSSCNNTALPSQLTTSTSPIVIVWMILKMSTRSSFIAYTTALLLTVATPALAQSSSAGSFDGLYAGAEIGISRFSSKATVTPITGSALSSKSDRTNANFGGFVGYGMTFGNRFYVSSDLEIGSAPRKSKTMAIGEINTRERANYEVVLSTRLGFILTDDTMIYAVAGSVRRESKFTTAGNLVRTATISGNRFGIGLMQACTENIFIRAELEKTEFARKSFPVTGQSTTRYQPETAAFSVGIGYRF
jgi:outer membrane immunogenic protein